MIIPIDALEKDTLVAIVQSNIVRGADNYCGDIETDTQRVLEKLKQGELVLIYSSSADEVTLVSKDQLKT